MSDSSIARDHLDNRIIHARGTVYYDLLFLNIDGFSDESEISGKEDMQLNFERWFHVDADSGDGGDNIQLDHTQILDLPIASHNGGDGLAVQAGAPAPTSGGRTATGGDQQGVGDRRSSNARTRRMQNHKRFRPYSNVTVSAPC